jgi:hypothetical protein
VIIDKTRDPSLQINDAEPFAIDSAEVQRDVEHSTLINVVRDGAPVTFTTGDRVTMWTGPNVVFMGKAIDEHSVLDLLSTEVDDKPNDYESI